MSTFAELGLSPGLLEALNALGYEEPTPIQSEAIPPLSITLVGPREHRLVRKHRAGRQAANRGRHGADHHGRARSPA